MNLGWLSVATASERSVEINELIDFGDPILTKSFLKKTWIDGFKKEMYIERGFIFKTRRVYNKNQFKKLDLVKKSIINMDSDLDDSLGYYLETSFELFAEMTDGKKLKI